MPVDFEKQLRLTRAAKTCAYLEGKLHEHGWHVALTGSTLYGRHGKAAARTTPPDIDLILYPHRDDEPHSETMEELLEYCGIKKYEQLGGEDYEGDCYKTTLKTGEQVHLWILHYPPDYP